MSLWRLLGVEHVAELRGKRVVFCSPAKRGSWALRSDAIQACKDAGIYELPSDGESLLVDGRRGYGRWE